MREKRNQLEIETVTQILGPSVTNLAYNPHIEKLALSTARETEQGAETRARTPLAQVWKTLCVGGTPSFEYVRERKHS